MTVAALVSRIDYLENGVTLDFPVPFRFLPSTLVATRVMPSGLVIALVPGVDYSVTGGSTDAGGTMTLVASVSGARLRLRRATARNQATDYTTGDRFPAESHEAALDRAMLIDQEQDAGLLDLTLRALLVPDGEAGMVLPAAALRANKYLAFDGAGGPYLASLPPVALPMWETIGIAAESLAANDFVNIFDSGPDRGVRQASAADRARFAHGFVLSAKAPGQLVSVVRFGVVPVSVVDVYGEVWLSPTNPGKFVMAAPTGDAQVIQPLGTAVPGEGIFFTYSGRVG